jgi:hypothetical protein
MSLCVFLLASQLRSFFNFCPLSLTPIPIRFFRTFVIETVNGRKGFVWMSSSPFTESVHKDGLNFAHLIKDFLTMLNSS